MKTLLLKPKIPQEFILKDGCYYNSKGKITEWSITQLEFYSTINAQHNCTKYIRFHIKLAELDKTYSFDCPLVFAIEEKALDIFFDYQIYALCSDNLFSKFISSVVKLSVFGQTPAENYAIDQGYLKLPNGKIVFGLGNEVVNASDEDPVISESAIKLKKCDNSGDFTLYLDKLINSVSFPPAAFIASLVAYVKPMFENELDEYGFTIYIYGDSGSGKSAITKLLVDYFEGSPNIINLHSNKSEIDKIFEYKHCCVAIDDLCGTDSNRERENNEQKLSENLKRVQTLGQIVRDGKKIKNESMLFVTGEYLLKSSSTLNRCLVVDLKDPIPPKEINKLYRNKDQYLEMVRCFIEWVCKNYDKLSEELNSRLSDVKNHKNKAVRYSGFNRNYAIKSLLFCTCDIFCEFIRSVSHDDMTMLTRRRSIENSIDVQIDGTLRHLENRSSDYASSRNIVEEVAVYSYSNIGQHKLRELTADERCPFVLWVGNKRLIKRRQFDEHT